MRLEDFLTEVEGDDSRHLSGGMIASTWDSLGRVWNIGPGLTHGITKDTVWNQQQLQDAENKEFAETRAAVEKLVRAPLSENQRTAVESLVYNIGISGFSHSTVLRRINARDFANVPAAFMMWTKAGGSSCKGLINRRRAEIHLWETPDEFVSVNVSTPKIAPKPDQEEKTMATANTASATSLPVQSAGLTTNPASQLLTHAIGALSFGLGVFGFATGAHVLVAAAPLLITVASFALGHLNVSGANANTIALVDNILTTLVPQSNQAQE